MGLEVTVGGRVELGALRQTLRTIGDKGLGKELAQGLQRAARPLAPALRESAVALMPSGYGPLLARSLRYRTALRGQRSSARLTVRIYGDGQSERRDVPKLNAGVLRHPVHGRTRPLKRHSLHKATSMVNPWVAQRVPVGFVDKPVDRLSPELTRQMQGVVDDVARQIKRS